MMATGQPRQSVSETGAGVALALAALLALSACETVGDTVDAVNPWSESDEAEAQPSGIGETPGEDQPFPNLATVPEKPKPRLTAEERESIESGLVADRERANYTDPVARSETVGTPPPPPAVPMPEVDVAPLDPSAQPSVAAPAPQPAPAPVPQTAAVPPAPQPTPMPAPLPTTEIGATVDAVYRQELARSSAGAAVPMPVPMPSPAAAPPTPQVAAVPAPATIPQPLESFDPTMTDMSANIATIYFGNNSSRLTTEARSALKEVAARQRSLGGILRVIGHASSRTRNMDEFQHRLVNFLISVDRANAVSQELMRNGVQPGALYVGAVSDSEQVSAEAMPREEAPNRRVEIYLDN